MPVLEGGDKKGWYFDPNNTLLNDNNIEAYNLAISLLSIIFSCAIITKVIAINVFLVKHFDLPGLNRYRELLNLTKPIEEWRKKYADELDRLNPNYRDEE